MINSQTQFVHPILFPLFALVNSRMNFKFLVDWRGFLHWEGLKVGYVGDKQQMMSKTDKVCRNGQTTQMHIMHTHKHSHWLWYWYSSFALCFANCLCEVWNISLVNVQLNPRGMQKTWHEKEIRNEFKSCGTCGLCLCIIQKYDTDSAPWGE